MEPLFFSDPHGARPYPNSSREIENDTASKALRRRKKKQEKLEPQIKAEDIADYKGDRSIEELINFINGQNRRAKKNSAVVEDIPNKTQKSNKKNKDKKQKSPAASCSIAEVEVKGGNSAQPSNLDQQGGEDNMGNSSGKAEVEIVENGVLDGIYSKSDRLSKSSLKQNDKIDMNKPAIYVEESVKEKEHSVTNNTRSYSNSLREIAKDAASKALRRRKKKQEKLEPQIKAEDITDYKGDRPIEELISSISGQSDLNKREKKNSAVAEDIPNKTQKSNKENKDTKQKSPTASSSIEEVEVKGGNSAQPANLDQQGGEDNTENSSGKCEVEIVKNGDIDGIYSKSDRLSKLSPKQNHKIDMIKPAIYVDKDNSLKGVSCRESVKEKEHSATNNTRPYSNSSDSKAMRRRMKKQEKLEQQKKAEGIANYKGDRPIEELVSFISGQNDSNERAKKTSAVVEGIPNKIQKANKENKKQKSPKASSSIEEAEVKRGNSAKPANLDQQGGEDNTGNSSCKAEVEVVENGDIDGIYSKSDRLSKSSLKQNDKIDTIKPATYVDNDNSLKDVTCRESVKEKEHTATINKHMRESPSIGGGTVANQPLENSYGTFLSSDPHGVRPYSNSSREIENDDVSKALRRRKKKQEKLEPQIKAEDIADYKGDRSIEELINFIGGQNDLNKRAKKNSAVVDETPNKTQKSNKKNKKQKFPTAASSIEEVEVKGGNSAQPANLDQQGGEDNTGNSSGKA